MKCRKLVIPKLLYQIKTNNDKTKLPCMYGNEDCICTYHLVGEMPTKKEIVKNAISKYKNYLYNQLNNPMIWGKHRIEIQFEFNEVKKIKDNFDEYVEIKKEF